MTTKINDHHPIFSSIYIRNGAIFMAAASQGLHETTFFHKLPWVLAKRPVLREIDQDSLRTKEL
jgi:hypothetical protein